MDMSNTGNVTIPAGTLQARNQIMIFAFAGAISNGASTVTQTLSVTGETNITRVNNVYGVNVWCESVLNSFLTDKDNTSDITISNSFAGLGQQKSICVIAINKGEV